MANENAETPSLKTEVPKIVITEIPPLNLSSSTVSIAYACASEDASSEALGNVETAATPATEASVDQLGRDSSDEYSPVQECVQCVVPVPDPVAEQRVDVEDVERGTPDIEDDDLRNVSAIRAGSLISGLRRLCFRCSEITDSKYSIILWFLLLVLPISSGFMGTRYLKECKMSPSVPALLFIMGITGVMMSTSKILVIMYDSTWEDQVGRPCLDTMVAVSFTLTLILFCTELMTFWRYSPNFDIISPQYCNQTLYNFTYWFNWISVALVIILFIFGVAKCLILRPTSY